MSWPVPIRNIAERDEQGEPTLKISDERTYDAPNVTEVLAKLRSLNDPPVALNSLRTGAMGTASSAPANPPPGGTHKIPVGRADERDPRTLDEHPLLRQVFGLGTDDENQELLESLDCRQYRPVLITGTNCHSEPDTVLDGRRLRRASLKLGRRVKVEVLDGLSAEMEATIIVHSNIASGLARRYDEEAKAALEHHYVEKYGKKQGERTDLTSVQMQGSDRRETPQIVADLIRQEFGDDADVTPTAIQERQVVFYDPLSSAALKRAVKGGKIARRTATDLVRKQKRDPEVAAFLQEARTKGIPAEQIAMHSIVVKAKASLNAEVEKLLNKKAAKKRQPRPAPLDEVEGTLTAGLCEVSYLGARTEVRVLDRHFRLKKLGPADDSAFYDPRAPTTRTSWVVDVAAAVDELPGDQRAMVTIGAVEFLEPVRCPTCDGTIFYQVGGCTRCAPLRNLDQEVERECEAAIKERHEVALAELATTMSDEDIIRTARRAADRETFHELSEIAEERRRVIAEDDPRYSTGTYRRAMDLRRPRQRITLSSARGNLDVVLWENLAHRLVGFAMPHCAGVQVGEGRYVRLDARGEGSWNYCRAALRQTVRQAITHWLRPSLSRPVEVASEPDDDLAVDMVGYVPLPAVSAVPLADPPGDIQAPPTAVAAKPSTVDETARTEPTTASPRLDSSVLIGTVNGPLLYHALTLAVLVAPKDARATPRLFAAHAEDQVPASGAVFLDHGQIGFRFESTGLAGMSFVVELLDARALLKFLSGWPRDVQIYRRGEALLAAMSERLVFECPSAEQSASDDAASPGQPAAAHVALLAPKSALLDTLKLAQERMSKRRRQVRLAYDATVQMITVSVDVTGTPVADPIKVRRQAASLGDQNFTVSLDIGNLRRVVRDCKAIEIDLRMAHHGDEHRLYTVEEFWLDHAGKLIGVAGMTPDPLNGRVFRCLVTRTARAGSS
jgi:hypothetical protein